MLPKVHFNHLVQAAVRSRREPQIPPAVGSRSCDRLTHKPNTKRYTNCSADSSRGPLADLDRRPLQPNTPSRSRLRSTRSSVCRNPGSRVLLIHERRRPLAYRSASISVRSKPHQLVCPEPGMRDRRWPNRDNDLAPLRPASRVLCLKHHWLLESEEPVMPANEASTQVSI